jgi:hypothetical protein
MKDEFLANLVATNKRVPDSKLVQEIGSEKTENENMNSEGVKSKTEGPSMMDMMMAAHLEAKKEEIVIKKEEAIKVTKTFGGGFKKGFFGDKKGVVKEKLSEKDTYLSWIQNKHIDISDENGNLENDKSPNTNMKIESSSSSAVKNSHDIPTIKRNKKLDLSKVPSTFTADVQKALSEEESPVCMCYIYTYVYVCIYMRIYRYI